ncbi:hypothetical protein DMC30DRAFT_431395, partial [Rhodotorula diobovata]
QKSGSKTTQKAVRERRQEYVTELEEKVRRLEAGEGDKCVFYQQQAQRAKTESAALQQENDTLKKEIEVLRRELERAQSGRAAAPPAARGAAGGKDKGKGRAAPREFDDSASAGPTKRPRRSAAVRASVVVAQATGSSSPVFHYPPAESPVPALSPAGTSSSSSHSAYHQRCTFCPADDNCFCAQVGYEIAPSPLPLPSQTTALLAAASSPAAQIKLEDADDLYFPETTYEPAVPLRLRKSGSKAPSVWAIEAPRAANAQSKRTVVAGAQAVCSGDPSNCPACSDDPFGKAFCNALSSTVCSSQPCTNCPSHTTSRKIPTPPPETSTTTDEETALFESLTDLPCCGDPRICGSLTCRPSGEGEVVAASSSRVGSASVAPEVETVPCNEAWTALKQHPNIAFADLQMLADVVAKRTFCGGPVCSTPPPPAGLTSETFPAARADSQSQHRPELVPQATLQCSVDAGARKRLTVERGAVNEALDLLDRAVARGGPLRH